MEDRSVTQLCSIVTQCVQKVFLIGGFGAAPSLRTYLKKFLCNYVRERKLSFNIELVLSDEQTWSVDSSLDLGT
jgi:hypothetical protein